jgi:putative ABC transport system substrate-binding protein
MKRREFIALTAGVVASWPGRAEAQQGKRVKLAFVNWRSPAQVDDVDSLRQGLRDLGYIEGKNIEI